MTEVYKTIERKVYGIGNAYTITLPIQWARAVGIKLGDTVEMQYNGVLTVLPKIDFRIQVKEDFIWFYQEEKKVKLTKKTLMLFLNDFGIKETAESIKKCLVENYGFSPSIPVEDIETAIKGYILSEEIN